MGIFNLNEAEQVEVVSGCFARFVHSEFVTIAHWDIRRDSPLPEHSHPHEQVAQILEGEFEITIDGLTTLLKPGMVAVIPPNARHGGRAITDCKIIDVFHPIREDYLDKGGKSWCPQASSGLPA